MKIRTAISVLCLSVLDVGLSSAFTFSSNLKHTPSTCSRKTVALYMSKHGVPALTSPLFARTNEANFQRPRRHGISKTIRKCIIRLVAMVTFLGFWRGALPEPAVAALPGSPAAVTKQPKNNRVSPILRGVAVASGVGFVVAKNPDVMKTFNKQGNDEEEGDEDALPPITIEDELELEVSEDPDRLLAQQLVEKTLKEVQEAERRAVLNQKLPQNANGTANTLVDKALQSGEATKKPEAPAADANNSSPPATSVTSPMILEEREMVEAVTPEKPQPIQDANHSSPAMAEATSEKVSTPKTITKLVKPEKPQPKEVVMPRMLTPRRVNNVLQQPKPTKEEMSLQTKYASMDSEEKAFNILVDLGLVELSPDPDDPTYDHSRDDDIVEGK